MDIEETKNAGLPLTTCLRSEQTQTIIALELRPKITSVKNLLVPNLVARKKHCPSVTKSSLQIIEL